MLNEVSANLPSKQDLSEPNDSTAAGPMTEANKMHMWSGHASDGKGYQLLLTHKKAAPVSVR